MPPFFLLRSRYGAAACFCSLALLMFSLSASAATVTNINDSGAGSLRAAIVAAAPGETIDFAVTGLITLTTGELVINKNLTIQGPGANLLSISGNNASRVFYVDAGVAVTISGLTITRGNGMGAFDPGANGFGGGILSRGTLMLTNCHITGNSAATGGGGVSLSGAPGTFTGSTFSNNTTGFEGGGILYQGDNSTLTLVNCTISGNHATGLGFGGGILHLSSTPPSRNISSTLQVFNSTIANNIGASGGGIHTSALNGEANGNGACECNISATTILRSTIIANNTLPNLETSSMLGSATYLSQGYNLANDDGGGWLNQSTDIRNTDPQLGALANNGGPTPTLALSATSPALDKGLNFLALTTDQRSVGFARTVDFPGVASATGGDSTDIGAFELNSASLPVLVSDTKAGSILVFPYYTSTIGGASDTRITISNIATGSAQSLKAAPELVVVDPAINLTYVHLFLIDGATCQQSDFYLCLTPNASFSFKASDYDPGNTGYVIAVAVNNQGVPIRNNVLIGNAFVNTPQFADNYGAEAFWADTPAVAVVNGNMATLQFNNVGYDAVPNQFAVEIQSPLDAPGQQVVTASLSGDLTTGSLRGAAQVGTGQAYNEREVFASFTNWLTGTCQAFGTISTTNPRVPNGLGNLIKSGQAGLLKFNVGAAVGLLMTPRTATWRGIRTLHKTQTTATTITIPIFVPVC